MSISCSLIETEYFTLRQLSDGVYAAIAISGKGAWSNAGFVDLGDELLVFDSFATSSAAQSLRNLAEELTGKPIKYLVNSHYHGDHVFGNQEFMDASIISTELTRQLCEEKNSIRDLKVEKKEMEQYLFGLKKQIDEEKDILIKESLQNQYIEMNQVFKHLSTMKIVLPTLVFDNSLIIHGSKRDVQLFCFGGGHTPSDTFLYIPAEKIAFTGDILTESLHVPIYHPDDYLAILKKINQMNINTVLPGHGQIGTLSLCDTLTDYVTYLIKKAKEAHESNISLESFISTFVTPDSYKNWSGTQGIKGNLATVYHFYANL